MIGKAFALERSSFVYACTEKLRRPHREQHANIDRVEQKYLKRLNCVTLYKLYIQGINVLASSPRNTARVTSRRGTIPPLIIIAHHPATHHHRPPASASLTPQAASAPAQSHPHSHSALRIALGGPGIADSGSGGIETMRFGFGSGIGLELGM